MMSERTHDILKGMQNSCTTEGAAAADCLEGIAKNGDLMATDEHLVVCAKEIKEWAKYFIERVQS